MVKVYYTSVYDIDKPDTSLFSEYRKERLSKITNKKNYLQSVFAEYLLCYGALKSGFKVPADIYISQKGKPLCDEFYFSISHSNKIVAVAISKQNVGVDVQFKKTPLNMSVAKKIFTPDECENMDINDFYKKFTMKESYYKMTGEGLPLLPVAFSDFKPNSFNTCVVDEYYFSVCTSQKADVTYEFVDLR